jgi:hypothetical protein
MANLSGRISVKVRRDGWVAEIDRLIESYNDGDAIINGSLTVTGHSYWVILEYGSSPRTPNAGPKPGDVVQLKVPFNAPPFSKGHTQWYPIRPRKRKMLVWKEGNRIIRRRMVTHPGNFSRGFIRRIVYKVQQSLLRTLVNIDRRTFSDWSRDDTLPDRDDLVELLNRHLLFILEGVRASTPVGPMDKYLTLAEDAGHLKDSWGIDLAK